MKISAKALRTFELSIQTWRHDEKTVDIAHVYDKDRIALRKVLNRLKKGDIKGARNLIDQLDSIVRDQIPSSIYDKVYEEDSDEKI